MIIPIIIAIVKGKKTRLKNIVKIIPIIEKPKPIKNPAVLNNALQTIPIIKKKKNKKVIRNKFNILSPLYKKLVKI